MMDPDYEVADLSQVIDWSLSHLPGVQRLDDGSYWHDRRILRGRKLWRHLPSRG